MDVRADPVGGLHQHARRAVVDLGARAAHDAGDRGRALVVFDDEHLRVEAADLVVERRDLLAVVRAADREPVARDAVEVERVDRVAGLEHHVVGDVDDVRDRALAGGHEARLQPGRRRGDRDVLEHARGEARVEVGGLDADLGAVDGPERAGVVGPRRRPQRGAGRGVDLARDAVDAQAVGPVRRDLELEDVGRDRQDPGQRRAGGEVGAVGDQVVEDHDPGVLGADGELVLGQDHPLGLHAAQLRLPELRAAGHDGAGPGDRDRLAGGDVRSAADDLGDVPVADVDAADAEAVGVGVLRVLEHLADDEELDRVDAVVVDGLDLRAGHRQALLELARGEPGVRVAVEPFDGRAHQPNCSRKRRSLS